MLEKNISTKIGLIILGGIFLASLGILIYAGFRGDLMLSSTSEGIITGYYREPIDANIPEIKKFLSVEDFKKYLDQGRQDNNYTSSGVLYNDAMTDDLLLVPQAKSTVSREIDMESAGGFSPSADRVSNTNVQVVGIDEPDIVKTDGQNLFISRGGNIFYPWRGGIIEPVMPMNDIDIMMDSNDYRVMPNYYSGQTDILTIFPVAEMQKRGVIENGGNLLLSNNILVVFTYNQSVIAYDVSDKNEPKEKWVVKFDDQERYIGARLMSDKLYLITQRNINYQKPCPIIPFSIGEKEVSIGCGEIYYSTDSGSSDVTYNFSVLDLSSGEVKNKSAFVGSSGQTVFYMSENNAYITYPLTINNIEVIYLFFSQNKDLVPGWVIDRLAKVKNYDLSLSAKNIELSSIMNQLINSLGDDEYLRLENELTNKSKLFYDQYKRDIGKTGVVKIDLNDFSVKSGVVPGSPLNQFSLDEYQKHLRIAVTIGQNWRSIGGFNNISGSTVNDVYVLDENLKITGEVTGLGETEKIYSVRFIGDRGYVVTFREIDPFYVLDLGNPKKPVMRGELKIPGYSSYLHSLGNHKVLGIGREDNQVKLSVFDSTVAENPVEIAQYRLNEYWSEALDNHHAFLLDEKHKIFFIPGSKGGYIFSFDNNKLELKSAVSMSAIQRAIYLNDYMYLIAQSKIVVLDENNWQKIKEFNF